MLLYLKSLAKILIKKKHLRVRYNLLIMVLIFFTLSCEKSIVDAFIKWLMRQQVFDLKEI